MQSERDVSAEKDDGLEEDDESAEDPDARVRGTGGRPRTPARGRRSSRRGPQLDFASPGAARLRCRRPRGPLGGPAERRLRTVRTGPRLHGGRAAAMPSPLSWAPGEVQRSDALGRSELDRASMGGRAAAMLSPLSWAAFRELPVTVFGAESVALDEASWEAAALLE